MTRFNDQRAALEEGLADDNAFYAEQRRNGVRLSSMRRQLERPDETEVPWTPGDYLAVGEYRIAPIGDGTTVWIGHASGEGMAIAAAEVEDALARLWRERF